MTIQIDGSQGEGGGQILRSALALSMALGKPFAMSKIRANRPKPGLMRQHLTAVEAAAAICGAAVTGAAPGSRELTFRPGAVRGGTHHFSVGTAGSTTLVLQAILPALLFADEASDITIEGGTHAKWAPPFEFLEAALVPQLNKLGSHAAVSLERHGFYPAGGGRLRVQVRPTASPLALRLESRGEVRTLRARVLIAKLHRSIAERELERVREVLGWEVSPSNITHLDRALSPGNVVLLDVMSEHGLEVCSAIGEPGRPGQAVADEAIDQARAYLSTDAPVGEHMADQLMVPLTIASLRGAGRCTFRTGQLSRHAATNAEVVELFAPGASRTTAEAGGVRWEVGG